jgi:hypothetical protein
LKGIVYILYVSTTLYWLLTLSEYVPIIKHLLPLFPSFSQESVLSLSLFCSTGVWTRGLYLEPLHQPFFVLGFFEIGSHELFAWAGFELRFCWSLLPKKLGLQTWVLARIYSVTFPPSAMGWLCRKPWAPPPWTSQPPEL